MKSLTFAERLSILEKIATTAAPSVSDAEKVAEIAAESIILREQFFRALKSPLWFDILIDDSLLNVAPEESGRTSWPAAPFLLRVCRIDPDRRHAVIAALLSEARFPEFVDFVVDCALSVPAKDATPIALALSELTRFRSIFPERLGQLVSYLASGKEYDSAYSLAARVFEIIPDSDTPKENEEYMAFLSPHPRSHFDAWHFDEAFRKCLPALIEETGSRVIKFVSDLLIQAIVLSRSRADLIKDDYSYIWRPTIAGDGHRHGDDIKETLVSLVRDASLMLARLDPSTIPAIIQSFDAREWPVFQRLSLHILAEASDAPTDLIESKAIDESLFESSGVSNEYDELLKKRFGSLSPKGTTQVLGYMNTSPKDAEENRQSYIARFGEEEGNKIFERWMLREKRDRLAPIASFLGEKEREAYEELCKELGAPEARLPVTFTSWSGGSASPKEQHVLNSMGLDDLLKFMREWTPSDDDLRPSREGLARQLQSVVTDRAAEMSGAAEQWKGLDPTYVRHFFYGIRDASAQKKEVNWEAVLELGRWVNLQKGDVPDRDPRKCEGDSHWGWTRKAIVDSLSTGFDESHSEIPFELRSAVWDVLEPITSDPDPDEAQEANKDETKLDPYTMAINSTRGEAISAVVKFAMWVKRHLLKTSTDPKSVGLDKISDAEKVLRTHLETDPSVAVRSVYGRWLPWLAYLDEKWTKDNEHLLFPSDSPALKDAVWETYLVSNQPWDQMFHILEKQYRDAGLSADSPPRYPGIAGRESKQALGDHLMAYYWRGLIPLNPTDNIIRIFFSTADPDLKAHAIQNVGRSLKNTDGEVPRAFLNRLEKLWEWRIKEAESATDRALYSKELAEFGWWYYSKKFPPDMAFKILTSTIAIAGAAQPDEKIVEMLVEEVVQEPIAAVNCLAGLVEAEKKRKGTMYWHDEAKKILTIALESRDRTARQAAVDLINRIMEMGHINFRELLEKR